MKYLRYFEAFEIKSIPHEETQFKELIKKLDPLNFNKYFTLYKNKGLEVAKKKLLDNTEVIKGLENEVKKIRRYEKRAKENLFNIAPDDLNYYRSSKKDTKQFISDGILTDDLKRIYKKYGFRTLNEFPLFSLEKDTTPRKKEIGNIIYNNYILNSDNYKYTLKTNKHDTEIDVNFRENKLISFGLGNLINILETSGGKSETEISTEVDKELNETKISGASIYKKFKLEFKQKFTPICNKILDTELYFELSYGIRTHKYYDFTLMDMDVEDKMNGKFVPMVDEKATELLNSIKDRTTKTFMNLGNKIRNEQPKADIKYKEFINNILTSCVELLNNNSARYYRNVNLIKENYPIAWEILKTKINDEEGLNKASEMGDMGFSD